MTSSVTSSRGNDGAQLQVGIALSEISESYMLLDTTRLQVAWTDAATAGKYLHNPWAQVSVGAYYAVHTGQCSYRENTSDSPLVNITDPADNAVYCMALDQNATGPMVSRDGKLILSRTQVLGMITPGVAGSNTLPACTTVPNYVQTSHDEWSMAPCQIASLAATPDVNALFVVAAITTPEFDDRGPFNQVGNLTFFVQALPGH